MTNSSRLTDIHPYVVIPRFKATREFTLVDLFAGIGGFHYGIAAACARSGGLVTPLLVSEIEPSCQEVYRTNHHCGDVLHGDVNKVDLRSHARDEADFLTAGFPCQPFSNSGLKLGLNDPRGQFYATIENFILKFKAKAFILENVPGIMKNGGGSATSRYSAEPSVTIGKTLQTLESAMQAGLGKKYDIKWLEFDSSLLGSPQVRKRVYIVGLRKDLGRVPDLRVLMQSTKRNAFTSVEERLTETDRVELSLNPNQEKNIRDSMRARRPSFKDGMRRVGNAYTCKGGNVGQGYHAHGLVPTLTKVWARFLPIYFPAAGERLPEGIDVRDFVPDDSYGSGSIRRVSVREAMRLQGFPEEFIPHPTARLAYEHAGNAVNAMVVREIAGLLLPQITD
jgi:DNA (cytosine-5)-methyltransferase 1